MKKKPQKIKAYISIAVITIIIITAWVLNLSNTIKKNETENDQTLEKASEDFKTIIMDIKNFKQNFQGYAQSSTGTAEYIQPSQKIDPEKLEQIVEQINLNPPSSTVTTSPQIEIKLPTVE